MRSLLLFLLVITSQYGHGRYLSAYSGFHFSQHQYLVEDATLTTPYVGARLDSTHFRRKGQGWFSRGVAAQFSQGQNYQQFDGQIPFFQWTKHQGIWLDYFYSKQSLEADLAESAIFLGEDGTTTSIAAGSNVTTDFQISRLSIYWYESTQYAGPINYLGVFQTTEITPAASTLTGTNASIFDGSFTGFGLTMGRKKDTRGLNFQWRLRLAQLNSDFSDNVTGHRALSTEESTVYQLAMDLNWHYRYYLAPYWYLVPEIRVNFSTSLQTTMDPQQVDHDAFIFIGTQSLISLQKRF